MTSSKIERGRILVYSEKFPPYRLELERKENLHMGNQMPRQKQRAIKKQKESPILSHTIVNFCTYKHPKTVGSSNGKYNKIRSNAITRIPR